MEVEILMMILLNGHSLTAKNKFMPERMQVQLSERGSTATMTLSEDAPTLSIGDWVQYEDNPIKGIVWRVKTVDTQIETKTITVQLEHAINTLKDLIIFGEVKPSDISGSEDVNPLASQTARFILSRQSDWVLGAVERDRTNPYGFNGENLYAALETVSGSMTECVWEYDFSRYPFVLNMRAMSNTVASEMRTDRNIGSLRKTVDRTRMYTRHYPIGKEDLHLTGEYVSKNENIYGVICKTETDQSLETEEALRLWATERLNRHCEPIVTITIKGLDLSEATGEPLDSFMLNRICRVPLPEYDTTISERVAKLNYADVIHNPMDVTVTLANELTDIASIIRNDRQAAASGGRGSAKKAGEDHAWFVDTDTHVGMVAEAVAGEGADKDWSRVAQVMVDGQGIHQRVTYTEDACVRNEAGIEVLQDSVTQFVSAVGADGKITAASICLAIEKAGSTARISADHITLGTNELSSILTIIGSAVGVSKPLICSSDLTINSRGKLNCQTINLSGSSPITLTSIAMAKAVKDFEIKNGVLTLERWNGEKENFSKATTITQSWSSGNKSVKATASGAEDKYFSVDYRFNAGGGQYYLEMFGGVDGASNPLASTSRTVLLALNGRTVEIQNGSGTRYANSPTLTLPEQNWSYSTYAEESNSMPSGSARSYDLDTRYTYHSIYITVDGTTRKISFRT